MTPNLKRLINTLFRGNVIVKKTIFLPLLLGCFALVGQDVTTFFNPPEKEKIIYLRESEEFQKTLAKIYRGIVYCYSGNSKTTGFFVSDDGWIITAGHKVDKDFPTAEKIYVKLTRGDDQELFESERVIAPPKPYDLLLVKINHKPQYYFKDFKIPHLFEENWIIGFRGFANICIGPSGYATTNTLKPHLYYTTASIYYGNSGSPVINRYGQVLGVAVEGMPMGDGLFVPAQVILKYLVDNGVVKNE